MFTRLTEKNTNSSTPKEGELFKVIELHGKTFEIRYGYYDDIDRKYAPVEIYPDFIKNPVYTDDGYPFITLMQDACEHYIMNGRECDTDCGFCKYMERGEELIGVCRCKARRKNE